MYLKKIGIQLIVLIFITGITAYITVQAATTVGQDPNGALKDVSTTINSTGASVNSEITYTTRQLLVIVGGYEADFTALLAYDIAPGVETSLEASIKKQDIINKINVKYKTNISQLLLNPDENVKISAIIDIYNKDGKVIDTYSSADDVRNKAPGDHFKKSDIDDMLTRYSDAAVIGGTIIQPTTNGLRPSVLVGD